MTPTQMETLREIRRLLAEAYEDYFERGDGHHKSSEGHLEVHYPNVFQEGDPMEANAIGIYSYVLGPSRMHYWTRTHGPEHGSDADRWVKGDPIEAALKDVREWHRQQMEWRPED